MTVIEKINEINDVLKEVFNYTQTEPSVKTDFDEYLSTIGARDIPVEKMEKIFLPYVFERKIDEISILEMFRGKCTGQKDGDKYINVTDSLINAQASIFEIKKVLKNGFELYNLINEKLYTVSSLTKMTNFRGVYAGQYIVARIFEFGGEYYVIEISSILSHSQKEDAYRYAVMKLINTPRMLYYDNKEKEEEIKNTISEMYEKFIKAFDTDIILTTNKYADDIIGSFNEGEEIDLSDKGCNIEEYKFFHVKELDNNYSNFLENSMGGFSSHSEIYDVAVMFDKEKGLYAIPFYETFCKIFENKDSVENAKQCVEYFLTNDSVPNTVLEKVAAKYPNFTDVVNEFMGTDYSLKDLIQNYKAEYFKNTIYSSATVLFCSNAFTQIFDYISEPKEQKPATAEKVGRNEPCPCGSGKKYKNCCGA